MPNYANAHDLLLCEPPDNSLEEAAFERACEWAFDEYLEDGWLPGGYDPSEVDARQLEQIPEALDELIQARDDEALLEVAKRIRDKRIEIVEELIRDNLKIKEAA